MNDIFNIVKKETGAEIFKGLEESPAKQYWGPYIHEGELSILFGDSNAGKSILANDIAFHVCGGLNFWGFESPRVPALYIDMEMTKQQFVNRYKDGAILIPETYSRATIEAFKIDEKMILPALKANIIESQAEEGAPKFIVIDNITNGFGSIHSAAQMRSLICDLKNMKQRFNLTILLIAHCPKRQQGKPITQDNLGGSKMILNFVDSAFAIATSLADPEKRYVKQIKTRLGAKMSEVATAYISTDPYLHFEFEGYTNEDMHLFKPPTGLHPSITPAVEPLLIKYLKQNWAYRAIAKTLGIPESAVVGYAVDNDLCI